MYFSVDAEANEGLLRALAVVAEKPISADDPRDEVLIFMDALYEVLHHGEGYNKSGDNHRFSLPPEQDKSLPVVSGQANSKYSKPLGRKI